MLMKSRILVFILMIILLISLPTSVLGSGHKKDTEGAQDHPLISRFPDSIIRHFETKKSDKYIFPTGENIGKLNDEGQRLDSKIIEGDITRITYEAPKDTSTLEIFNNYKSALKKAGFDIIFSGSNKELSWRWTINLYNRDINPLPGEAHKLAISEKDFRYLSAELTERNENLNDIYVSLTTTKDNDGIGIQLDIIEAGSPDEDLINVNLNNMATEMEEKGSVSIHNIYFDTGKADIKSESEKALTKISNFLKDESDSKFYVVGHTDSKGSLEFNMNLSTSRAEAVVKTLVDDYGVEAKRIKAHGVAFLAPKASNYTKEGRALNRRVELVKP
ncbi:MAG: DUF4892 domain-containing protein [Candidatus Muiribacteriota bacterium]